jgi:hypothetical protein
VCVCWYMDPGYYDSSEGLRTLVWQLLSWVHGFTFEGHVKPEIDVAVAALRARGAGKFAIVGFCW